MASGGLWSSMGCSVRMSSPRGYAGLSGVHITGISPFHRRSLDHALDRNVLEHLKEQFGGFFEDRWIAETLVDVALDSEAPPVDGLRQRYERLGFDSEALPVSFE